jgi:D-amino-acid dehydrogenase
MTQRKNVTVLGAGIIGVSAALYLQRDGHEVTLVDRGEPGMGCSYGNGGLIQVGSCVPVATPGILFQVPKMLFDPDQPLVVRWRHLVRLMPFLARFVWAARPSRVEQVSKDLATLLRLVVDAYEPLLELAGAAHLVENTGELYVYESDRSFESSLPYHQLRIRRGVDLKILTADDVYALEPALAKIFRHGVFIPGSRKTVDPYLFTKALADSFMKRGGRFVQAEVLNLQIGRDGPTALITTAGSLDVSELVIAAGAYSGKWSAALGTPVPLETERGYHLMLPRPNVSLRVPVVSGDYRFGMVQMTGGLRLAGTAELAKLDAPPNYERAYRLFRLASRALPGLNQEQAKVWMGNRPAMPDSLPVISLSPKFRSVYFAFGHGHGGIAMGGVTGRIIADLVANRTPVVDIQPFSVTRF